MKELKTNGNKLSVWQAFTDEDIEKIILALASNVDNISSMDIVKIKDEDIKTMNKDDSIGITPVEFINDKHTDLTDINYESLGILIEGILNGLKNDCVVHKTKKEIKNILVNALKSGELDITKISENLRNKIENNV